MIDIYICEDNQNQRDLFSRMLDKLLLIEDFPMRIRCCTDNPEQIIGELEKAENIGLFFLDIKLNHETNGIMLAQKIRFFQPRCFLVFITAHPNMVSDVFHYKLEPLDYIIKGNPEDIQQQIHDCLRNVNEKYNSLNHKIIKPFPVTYGRIKEILELQQILYLETAADQPHQLIIHTLTRSIRFTGQLKSYIQYLDESFVQCHRSYIVNLNYIQKINYESKEIILTDGTSIPIARRMIPLLRKKHSKACQ